MTSGHNPPFVTAVLVSHDGARWLPETLRALAAQTRPPDRVLAVDTGSADGSAALVEAALGAPPQPAPRSTGFGDAVRSVLATTPERPEEWVWLLHDDGAPEPDALAALLDLAGQMPSAGVVGPKCRDWSGRDVVEVGLTTDLTGRRDTGLEHAEADAGQHDAVRDVLGVGTAGALVRRELWERLAGLDPALPFAGDDLDFGWRAVRAGSRVVLAPQAVIRHAHALTTGQRHPDGRSRPWREQRAAALYVLLANLPLALALLEVPRLLLAALLRAAGLLLLRRPTDAVDELAAAAAVLGRPGRLRRARAARAGALLQPHAVVRPLLARPSVRLRAAAESLATLVRRPEAGVAVPGPRRPGVAETGPVAEEAENYDLGGAGLLRWLARRPGAVLFLGLLVLSLLACRHLLSGGLAGGALLPAPAGASDLWSAYASGWHPVGTGAAADAPPYLALLALLSTVLLGKAWLAVEVLVVGAVPLAGVAAYAAAGSATRRLPLRLWAAVTYALLPVATGAVAAGRLDVLVAAAALPLLLRSAWRLSVAGAARPPASRAFAAGLGLAAVAAFAPLLWALAAGAALGRLAWSRRGIAPLVAVATAGVLLLPWLAGVLRHPALLVAGVGRPYGAPHAAAHALLLANPGGAATPWTFLLVPLAAAALLAVARPGRHRPALAAWGLVVAGAALGLALTAGAVTLPSGERTVPWPGVALTLTGAGLVLAALLAADGAGEGLRRRSFGWRQPAAGLLAAALVAVPVVAGLGWLVRGAQQPLRAGSADVVPAFVAADLASAGRPRVLVLRPSGGRVDFALQRGTAGPRLGDAEVLRAGRAGTALRGLVGRLVAGSGGDVAGSLAGFAVRYVVTPARTGSLAARLDATEGLSRLPNDTVGLWRVTTPAARLTVQDPDGSVRTLPSGAVDARAGVPAGPAGRRLLLAEPRDGDWHATLDGRPLAAAPGTGWAQRFVLPARGGTLRVTRGGDGRAGWLALQAVALAVALVLALPTGRREDEPAAPLPAPEPAPVAAGSAR